MIRTSEQWIVKVCAEGLVLNNINAINAHQPEKYLNCSKNSDILNSLCHTYYKINGKEGLVYVLNEYINL